MSLKNYKKLFSNPKNIYLLFLSLLLCLLVGSVVVYESYNSYTNELSSAALQSKNMSTVLAKELSLVLDRSDFALENIQEQILEHHYPISLKNSTLFHKMLLSQKKKVKEVISFKIVDQQGRLIGDDGELNTHLQYNDREYFNILKTFHLNQLVFSYPLKSKTLGKFVVVMARPLLDSHKIFQGIVLATIDLNWLRQLFLNIDIDKKGSIILFDAKDIEYLIIPWDEKMVGANRNSPLDVKSFITSHQKSFNQILTSKNKYQAITSIERLENNQLFIQVEFPVNEVLKSWKKRTFMSIFLMILLSVIFFVLLINFLISLEELQEKQKQAVQNAKLASIGEMTASIAHEINNPLTIIAGLTRTIERAIITEDYSQTEKLKNAILKINLTIKRITRIIKGLKSFSHNTFEENSKKASLINIIKHSLDSFEENTTGASTKIIEIPFKDIIIECREIQIEQVIINLISNALDAIQNLDEKWVKISVLDLGKTVQISVQDSGKGIPIDLQDRIMAPFFTTKEIGKGTGLGLSISLGIINSHHGHFYLDNKNINTTFNIELPKSTN